MAHEDLAAFGHIVDVEELPGFGFLDRAGEALSHQLLDKTLDNNTHTHTPHAIPS